MMYLQIKLKSFSQQGAAQTLLNQLESKREGYTSQGSHFYFTTECLPLICSESAAFLYPFR